MINPYLMIGPLIFHIYGLVIAVSIYLGWLLAKRRSSYYKIPRKIFDDPILLIPLFLGIVLARVYHVIDKWNLYQKDPISVLYIANGGLGIWGGLLGVFLGLLWI